MMYKTIGYCCFCVLVLFACKKESKEPIYITMQAILAHNNQPVSGIKWEIIESKGGGLMSEQEITDRELTGETDQNGISVFQFFPLKDKSYQYDIYFDYTTMNVPSGDYSIVLGPTTFAHITRQGPNNYDIRVLPKMDVQVHYKNVNCFDGTDSFKHKSINLEENPYITVQDINNLNLVANNLNQGCVDRWGGGAMACWALCL